MPSELKWFKGKSVLHWINHFHQNVKTYRTVKVKIIYTLMGQRYFHTKIFPYIFHIKPLIFITFSWSNSLDDFHEMFTFNSRIIRVYFSIFMSFFRTFVYKHLWFKHKCKSLTSQFYDYIVRVGEKIKLCF